jgi:hypothetical protein
VKVSYAVVWSEGDGPTVSGRLELHPRSVVLDGAVESKPVVRTIPFNSLTSISVGHAPEDRLADQPSLVLERRDGPTVRVTSVAQPGIVSELARQVIRLQVGEPRRRRVLVMVPLKPGSRERAHELVDSGPPFDVERIGLTRHEVFLSDEAAFFLFEVEGGSRPLDQLLAEPELWRAASTWHDIVAGPPQIADESYEWEAPPPAVHGLGF